MQRKIFLWACIFICSYVPNMLEAQQEDTLIKIVRANESYHEKNYQLTIKIFENLITKGESNGYLYYNLGNTYMRLGNQGHAILNYIRAKKLFPRNENLNANLRYAISQTIDQLPLPQQGFINGLLFWMDSISLTEHFKLLFVFNLIFWLVAIGMLYFRKSSWKILKNIFLAILLITFFSTGIKYYLQGKQIIGVILESEVEVKSDRGIQDKTLFQLHEGAIISIKQEDEDWVKVSLDNDNSGWVPKKTIGY